MANLPFTKTDAESIRFSLGECSMGKVLIAQSDRGICEISMGDDSQKLKEDLQTRFVHAEILSDEKNLKSALKKIIFFIENSKNSFLAPLDIRGTDFQKKVWSVLQEIPVGTTVTYSEIAKKINMPKSYRAVASACAANTLAVVIPCHRVVRSDGCLSGYRWGVDRKRTLLENERKHGLF